MMVWLLADGSSTSKWIMIAIAAIVVPFFIYLWLQAQRLRKNGIPVRAWIVQANDALYEPGGDDRPALLIFSLPGERNASDEKLSQLAERMFALREARQTSAVESQVRKLVVDESFRGGFQTRLPVEFTGGSEVFCVHMEIRRDYLSREGVLKEPYVQVNVLRKQDPGKVEWIMMPYPKTA